MKLSVTLRGIHVNLSRAFASCVALTVTLFVLAACTPEEDTARLPATISGTVTNAAGPVGGALVQVQGTPNQTTTAEDGTFMLHGQGLGGSQVVTVTAWVEGHYIGWTNLDPKTMAGVGTGQGGDEKVEVALRPLFDGDNHEYTWFEAEGVSGSAACGLCHREFPEWKQDAHAQAATNPRFTSMFRGTNVQGERSQPTRFTSDGKGVMPPDPALPDHGPGFRLDNPDRAGTCATCHTPAAAKMPTTNSCAWSGCHATSTADNAEAAGIQTNIRGVSPVGIEGAGLEGVSCELCHKVREVILDPGTGLPYADMPGILSLKLARPSGDHQLFFGTLTDVSRERDSYLPLQSESEFCAACHFGVFGGVVSNMKMTGGTVIYNSYGEWLASPYSDPKTGMLRTCQDCHMPKVDTLYSVFPHRGGVARDYVTYHNHLMPGASSQSLLQNTVAMTAAAARRGEAVTVRVSLTNDRAGHAVPTDAPMRSVMLLVEAVDANGNTLPLKDGATLPEWAGNHAGRAGKAFARVLRDTWSGETPATAFWRPVTEVSDTRLFPFATDTTAYTFVLPAGTGGTVKVTLVYRRAFQKLAEQKGWDDPDIVMAEKIIPVQ